MLYTVTSASGHPVCVNAEPEVVLKLLPQVYHASTVFYVYWKAPFALPVGRTNVLEQKLSTANERPVWYGTDPMGRECFLFKFKIEPRDAPLGIRDPMLQVYPKPGLKRAQTLLIVDGWWCKEKSLIKQLLRCSLGALSDLGKM